MKCQTLPKLIMLSLALLPLGACVSAEVDAPTAPASNIDLNEEELVALLGYPREVSIDPEGQTWVYHREHASVRVWESVELSSLMSHDNRAIDFETERPALLRVRLDRTGRVVDTSWNWL